MDEPVVMVIAPPGSKPPCVSREILALEVAVETGMPLTVAEPVKPPMIVVLFNCRSFIASVPALPVITISPSVDRIYKVAAFALIPDEALADAPVPVIYIPPPVVAVDWIRFWPTFSHSRITPMLAPALIPSMLIAGMVVLAEVMATFPKEVVAKPVSKPIPVFAFPRIRMIPVPLFTTRFGCVAMPG